MAASFLRLGVQSASRQRYVACEMGDDSDGNRYLAHPYATLWYLSTHLQDISYGDWSIVIGHAMLIGGSMHVDFVSRPIQGRKDVIFFVFHPMKHMLYVNCMNSVVDRACTGVGRGDMTVGCHHVGDLHLLEHVQHRIKPLYHVFGHVHESTRPFRLSCLSFAIDISAISLSIVICMYNHIERRTKIKNGRDLSERRIAAFESRILATTNHRWENIFSQVVFPLRMMGIYVAPKSTNGHVPRHDRHGCPCIIWLDTLDRSVQGWKDHFFLCVSNGHRTWGRYTAFRPMLQNRRLHRSSWMYLYPPPFPPMDSLIMNFILFIFSSSWMSWLRLWR